MRMLDFSSWDQMLRQYVDDQGKVDYQSWQTCAQPLKDWLHQLAQLELNSIPDPNQRLAFWLNLYNALVIDQVLEVYPIASIRPTILGIPNWFAFLQFFEKPVYQMGERFYTLNDIEHKVIRPEFRDPRIHFALVCAAMGCPLLRNQAYQPEQLQSQLEEDARRFINNFQKVRYQPPFLYCSKIFQWYQQDFISHSHSIPQYVAQYLSPSVPLTATTPIRYLNYDWSLNQRTSS
jgi:hypothetical protein